MRRCYISAFLGKVTLFFSVMLLLNLVSYGQAPCSGPLASDTFTINSGQATAGKNYQSFNDAIKALACGISGPVVFNVTSSGATYAEQLIIPQITGASKTNTITFHGKGNLLSFSATNPQEPATIKLNGADHFIFDTMKISVAGSFGSGVHLLNNADSNTFRGCIISAPATSSSPTFAGVLISASAADPTAGGATLCDGNLFTGNQITGGYLGMTMVGGSGTGELITNSFVDNEIKDFYSYGIFVSYTNGAIIEGNRISCPTRLNTVEFNGIYFGTGSINARINRNRIFNPTGGDNSNIATTVYGIRFNGCDATSTTQNIVSNNLIYAFNGAGPLYGINNVSSDYAAYYNNTISLDNTKNTSSSVTRAFNQTGSGTVPMAFINNIFSIHRGGDGANFGMYISTTVGTFTSDNNNFFITPSATTRVGYRGGNRASLDNWKTGSVGKDLVSVAIDPEFMDTLAGNFTPLNVAFNDLGAPVGVTKDILNNTRSTTKPDIGAYEFTPAACTEPPVPGTVLSSTSPACIGIPFTLSITGGQRGVGLTFQWQSSADSAVWKDIPAATGLTATTSQLVTTFYRVVYKCGATTAPSAGLKVLTPAGLAGTYTIDKATATGGTNFQSFNAAYNAIGCGISGAVIFNVVASSGPYNEQLIMKPVPGASATNTITFNGNGNTISFLSTTDNQRAVIKLDDADYIRFNDLVITALGQSATEFGWGIQLTNNADFNVIRRCTINTDLNSTSQNYGGIIVSPTANSAVTTGTAACDDNIFEDNTVNGGFYGMTLVSSNTVSNQRNIIRRNQFNDFYNYGVYVNGSFTTIIDSNTISRPLRSNVSSFYGIYFAGLSTKANITRNTITNPFGGSAASINTFYGIYFSAVDAIFSLENLVNNNLIYNLTGNGDVYGIYNDGSDNVWYHHNTLHIDGANTSATAITRAFYQTTIAGGVDLKNNMITINRGGTHAKYAIYLNTLGTSVASDYNNIFFFTAGANNFIGFDGAENRATLLSWQNVAKQDLNSVSNDPAYINTTGNFTPQNSSIDNLGAILQQAPAIDILGRTRSTTTPDLGAYEFTVPPCVTPPIAGTTMVSETPLCQNTEVVLNVTGGSSGTTQTYQWQVASSLAGTYTPVSNVLTNPFFKVTPTVTSWYRLAVTCSGITSYSTPVQVTVIAALAGGTYTIDKDGTGDFLSFTEANVAMSCGINGAVVFNVKPNSGTYTEQLLIDSIRGTSASNTVTFNGNGNTIKFSSASATNRAVIGMSRTDYVTFDNLVIDATGTGEFGWGVHISNNAERNTFRNCTIIADSTATSDKFAGLVINSRTNNLDYLATDRTQCNYNMFENNTIIGGFHGVVMMTGAAGTSVGNKFINNKIKEFYYYGIYTGPSTDQLIEGNEISRPSRSVLPASGGFYGIFSFQTSSNLRISKNRIHTPFGNTRSGSNSAYAISINSNDAPDNSPTIVSNNIIYDFNKVNSLYAFNNNSSDNVHYLHNSGDIDQTGTVGAYTFCFNQQSTAKGLQYKNNVFSVKKIGTVTTYGFTFAASTTFVSDYNNIYMQGTGGENVYATVGEDDRWNTLASWRADKSQDLHSSLFDPRYISAATGNLAFSEGQMDDKGTPVGIVSDILNVSRSLSTPDMGAFEISLNPCTDPPVAGTSVATPSSGVCMGGNIVFSLTGNSAGALQKYVWQRSASATGPWVDVSDSLTVAEFTHELASLETFFRAALKCGTGISYSQPVQITLNPPLPAGDYSVDPAVATGGTNYNSLTEAVNALQCGIGGAVRFHVAPGTYNEQLLIRKVPGASAVATVTFRSRDNNAATTIIRFNSTADKNYIVQLNEASFINFSKLTLQSLSAVNSKVVEFIGGASRDSIVDNIITMPASANNAIALSGVFGNLVSGSDLVVKGNTITGGSTGIYLAGQIGIPAKRFVIENNNITDAYATGIRAGFVNDINVNGNTIAREGVQNASSFGIYLTACDSSFHVTGNNISIANTGIDVVGMYLGNTYSSLQQEGWVNNNRIISGDGNTGSVRGLVTQIDVNHTYKNNEIIVKTTGDVSYGIYSFSHGAIKYYNNSVQNLSASAGKHYTALFNPENGSVDVRNNIFSNEGGGVAYAINIPGLFNSDYNLLYTTGPILAQEIDFGSVINEYPTLKAWADITNLDKNAITYKPAFTSASSLAPVLTNAQVWALHGRGVQIAGNDKDINNNPRPVTLTTGVPDLGAYEFLPTVEPVLLTATPVTPAPNSTQIFMLGTDTVSVVTWGSAVPATVEARRYSGIIPPALPTGQQHMYFYTDFNTSGSVTGHTVKQFYVDSWLGSIASEPAIKMGRTNAAGTWEMSDKSTVNQYSNVISEAGLSFMGNFTGLNNGSLPPAPPAVVINPGDSSNFGTKFWTSYGYNREFIINNEMNMVLYIGAADKPAKVTVKVNGTNWERSYTVPANGSIASDLLPKSGQVDARLLNSGWSDRGISIESDVPVSAYAQVYSNSNSSGTLLLPVGTYGYEYSILATKQSTNTDSYSWFNVIAAYDSTVVQITPSKTTADGHTAGTPFTVNLKKGEVYQVLGSVAADVDRSGLTGSMVKSISNGSGRCFPIAVFTGSSDAVVGCHISSDYNVQQNLPYKAWGTRYLTAPFSHDVAANQLVAATFKVLVKNPATLVKRNGVTLTGLVNNLYYEFESNQADYIEASQPVMVAQYMHSSYTNNRPNPSCPVVSMNGDAEMTYLTSIEQGIKTASLYRNTRDAVTVQYLTLVIPASGLTSLTIDGSGTFDYVYDHPNLANYKVVVKRWEASGAQVVVKSDAPFTALSYGLGTFQSYVHNVGMQVVNLTTRPSITNTSNPAAGAASAYTCVRTPFRFKLLSTVQPTIIEWQLSRIPGLTPNTDVIQNNPVSSASTVINGVTYYEYILPGNYTMNTIGEYATRIYITHPDLDGCNARLETTLPVNVVAAPVADFTVTGNCAGAAVQFTGAATNPNGVGFSSWKWDFKDVGATSTLQHATHTFTAHGVYKVAYSVVAQDGCTADTAKDVTIGPGPAVTLVQDSIMLCSGQDAAFAVQAAVAGAVYRWYDAPTGGTVVHTGNAWTINNVTAAASYWVSADLNGCVSSAREEAETALVPLLTVPLAAVDVAGADQISFKWNAVAGALSYEVSVNGAAWQVPSSGATGLTHVITGLRVGQSVTFKVKAVGRCLPVESVLVTGTTVTDEVFVPNSFSPNGIGPVENERFRIYSNVIREIHFMIFSQWGEKLFEARNQTDAWDGTYKGKQQPSGVYIYVADIILNDGKKVQKKGSVNLVR